MKKLLSTLFESKKHVYTFFSALCLLVVLTNARWGYNLLGNDNFSPELDPQLTLQRSLENPGWRTYRALGVPSDSEQADTGRALIFYALSLVKMPSWAQSQIYLFGTFIIALLSAAHLAQFLATKKSHSAPADEGNTADSFLFFLFGGLFYISSLLTVWIYYFPVQLFVAAYAFLPLAMLRLLKFAEKATVRNGFFLSIAAVCLGISGLTATMFLVICATLVFAGFFLACERRFPLKNMCLGLVLLVIVNLYWLLPFSLYARSNTPALQDSLINRKITTLQVQNEQKYTVLPNTVRYAFSWIDDQLSDGTFAYTARGWYQNIAIQTLGYLPIVCAVFGSYILLRKKKKWGTGFIFLGILGIFLIKGSNSPFGMTYTFLQEGSDVFRQVFRWRSSKFWPLMAISIPVLATYGAVVISRKRPSAKLLLAGLLCLYILPMLTGAMIRPSMFVKVPQEYTALGTYLKQADPQARIYVAPEANTLYFRNYSWGFFGSVMLNYVLPNPTFEKALIIGSAESEHGFNVIKNAYYSGNIDSFNKALDLFNVEYVLDDRSVTKGESGYEYDLSLNTSLIESNPSMEMVWSQGELRMYKLKPHVDEGRVYTPISFSDTQVQKLAVAQFMGSMPNDTYQNDYGSLYPFLLQPDSAKYDEEGNITTTSTHAIDGDYTFSFPENIIQESPIMLTSSEAGLLIRPAVPTLMIDDKKLGPPLPQKSFAFELPKTGKLSLNDTVIDVAYRHTLPVRFADIQGSEELKHWDTRSTLDLLSQTSPMKLFCNDTALLSKIKISQKTNACGSGKMVLDDDTLLDATMLVSSSEPVQLSWCFSTEHRRECVESQRFYTVSGKAQQLSFKSPTILKKGDTVEMFLNFSPLSSDSVSDVEINQLTWHLYSGKFLPTTFAETVYTPETQYLSLKGSHQLSLTIPSISGASSVDLRDPMHHAFELDTDVDEGVGGAKMIITPDGVTLSNTESSSSFHATLPIISDQLLMVLASGTHTSGIPAEISVHSLKQGAALYENQFYAAKNSLLYDYMLVPHGNPTLRANLTSRGIGDMSSTQKITMLTIQPMPVSWLGLSLKPVNEVSKSVFRANNMGVGYVRKLDKPGIITLNTAVSPYWSIRKVLEGKEGSLRMAFLGGEITNAQRTIVNGWDQGFIVSEPGTYVIVFWPNFIIYAGYFLTAGLIIGMGIYLCMKQISKQRT